MLNIIPGIDGTASALNAERLRMEIVSQNIAQANVTSRPGTPGYQRQQVVFETVLLQTQQAGVGLGEADPQTVKVARVEKDHRPPLVVHKGVDDPNADAAGNVWMPNINVHEEMIDLMAASRAFEANLNVIRNARSMAMQTLSIGKR